MKKRIILSCLLGLSFLLLNSVSVYAWTCCKSASDIYSTCNGGSCSVSHTSCCDNNTAEYCTSISECSVSTPSCPSGYTTTPNGGSSCSVTCTGCDNSITCYQDNYQADDCECSNDWANAANYNVGTQYWYETAGCSGVYCDGTKPTSKTCTYATDCGWSDDCNKFYCYSGTCSYSNVCTYNTMYYCMISENKCYQTSTAYASTSACESDSAGGVPAFNSETNGCSTSPDCCGGYNPPPTDPPTPTPTDAYNPPVPTNNSPVFGGLVIKNNLSAIVYAESGNKNQICQSDFNSSRLVTFEVSASDLDGIGDISNITLTWNGQNISRTSTIGSVTTFSQTFPSSFNNSSTYPLVVTITDSKGATDSDSSRYFKIWDCNVPISGAIYDNSDGSLSCSNPLDPTKINTQNINFTSLTFTDSSGNKSMTVTQPSSYTSGANSLIWGKNYGYAFNSDFAVTSPSMKVGSLSTCQSTVNLNNSSVDPYSSSPTITADFFGVANQDPWWQVTSGGVISNNSVSNKVPVTCSTCKMSPFGLISAPNITNTGRPLVDAQPWYYKAPTAKLAVSNTSYSYFLSQYHDKNGIGTILTGDKTISDISDLGSDSNNIFFIDGNLNIDGDISKGVRDFLMIIVKGDITVTDTVTRVDGILVANDIISTGTNTTALTFNGSLYAANDINFTRSLGGSANNLNPAVIVNYDPKMIFYLPGTLAKVLTNWQWGN